MSNVTDNQDIKPAGKGVPINFLVIGDLVERAKLGTEKYGEPLKAHNGRDALKDAYQEALDLTVYLRQALAELDPVRTDPVFTPRQCRVLVWLAALGLKSGAGGNGFDGVKDSEVKFKATEWCYHPGWYGKMEPGGTHAVTWEEIVSAMEKAVSVGSDGPTILPRLDPANLGSDWYKP